MHTPSQAQTPGRALFDRQLAFLERNDIDGLIDTQYHPDAVLVGSDFVCRGHAALHAYFTTYLQRLGLIKVKSIDAFNEIEDAILFEATITTTQGEAKVYDVLLFKAEKVTHHFAGLISFTPHQYV